MHQWEAKISSGWAESAKLPSFSVLSSEAETARRPSPTHRQAMDLDCVASEGAEFTPGSASQLALRTSHLKQVCSTEGCGEVLKIVRSLTDLVNSSGALMEAPAKMSYIRAWGLS